MTTEQLIILDHGVAVLTAATWLAAGATAAARRPGASFVLLVAALVVTAGRVASAVVLAGRGWWFVQEKVLLGVPMIGLAGLVATLVAGPRLLTAIRRGGSPPPLGGTVVALLTAGYAGVAAFVTTFVVGYPASWSGGLITVSLVAAASLLTWRAVGPAPATPTPATAAPSTALSGDSAPVGTALSRRRFIGVTGGVVAAGSALAGGGLAFATTPSLDAGGGPAGGHGGPHRPVTALRGPGTPAPGGTVRRYTLTARTETVTLASGRQVQAWTYNGRLPGPPITAVEGDLIDVTLRNANIDHGVTLHWHGYDLPCGEDGAPGATQAAVMPGGEFRYRFRAQQTGTFWYHTHQVSHRGVRLGLYGPLVVTRNERPSPPPDVPSPVDLTLPVHTFDGTTVIGDSDEMRTDTVPPGTPVRLRLINTDSDPHRFALAGTPFRLVAVDGRDLHEPGEISGRAGRLPAGGRADLEFGMPAGAVVLVVDDDHEGGLRLRPGATGDQQPPGDTTGWPELDLLGYGEPASTPFGADSRFDRDFTLVLDRGAAIVDGRPAYAQTVNGRGHPSIPDQLVRDGDLVRFTVVNRSLENHPWHLHGHSMLVLSRDGRARSGSPLWVDTVDVRPGEVWQVAFRAANPGVWMNHCHNLPHADQGMMLRLRYDGIAAFDALEGDGGHDGGAHGP